MSAIIIKIIACIAMLIDHAAFVFRPQLDAIAPWIYVVCRMVGRIAFPLFAMCVAEGVDHTSNPKKYALRMFVFALIAQIPFSLMMGTRAPSITLELFGLQLGFNYELSVMVTLYFGLVISNGIHRGRPFLAAIMLLIAYLLDRFVGMDYGILGVLFIVGLFLTRSKKAFRLLVLFLFALCLYLTPLKEFAKEIVTGAHASISNGVLFFLGTLSAGLFMLAYNRKKGGSAKYFFYVFYPAHMLILTVLFYVMQAQ